MHQLPPPARDAAPRMDRRAWLGACALALAAGCGAPATGNTGFHAFGEQGLRDGSFARPRAVGVYRGEVYVIDMTGRVQVFDRDGAYRRGWTTPRADNGTPTAITFAGEVAYVPDTHYSRVLEYTLDGELLRMWGEYGSEPGQFIYPTGIARTDDGRFFLSEYGVNAERVQAFDAERAFVATWGSHGEGPGEFNRAMALTLGLDARLYVADTANHRVQIFSQGGDLEGEIRGEELPEGGLRFPHDISRGPDGTLYLAEYGANRISRFRPDGRLVATYGGPGRAVGAFNAPRGVAVDSEHRVFVADTDNHRVQWFDVEAAA